MTASLPLVSMCMPSYNYSTLIDRAIKSVLSQSYPNIELVIGENCSTDNTHEILKKYATDKRVHVYTHQKNVGQILNWKKCIELAKGEFLAYISADDQMLPNHVEHLMVPMMDDREPADLTWGGVIHAGAHNREVVCKMYEWFPLGFQKRIDYGYILSLSGQISAASLLWRKSVFNELGGFHERYGFAMEFEIPLRFARARKRIVHIPDITALHTMHVHQLSRRFESQENLYNGFIKMLEEYAIEEHHWQFHGFEHCILAHLQRYWHQVIIPSLSDTSPDHLVSRERHCAIEERIHQYAQRSPPTRPTEVPRVSLIAVCGNSFTELNTILENASRQEYTNWELIIYQYGLVSYEGYIQAHRLSHKVQYVYAGSMEPALCWTEAQELRQGELISYIDPDVTLLGSHLQTLVRSLDLSQALLVIGRSFSQIHDQTHRTLNDPNVSTLFDSKTVDYPANPIGLKSLLLHRFSILNYIPLETQHFSAISCTRALFNEWSFVLKCQNAGIAVGACTVPTVIAHYTGEAYWDFWSRTASTSIIPTLREIQQTYLSPIQEKNTHTQQIITSLDMCLQALADVPYSPALLKIFEGIMNSLGIFQDITPSSKELLQLVNSP